MKRLFFLLAFIGFCQIMAFSQKKYEMVIEKTDGSEIAINVEDIVRTYFRERSSSSGGGGDTPITGCPDNNHPHMIDLGLPSGTKWACCNVGANAPEEYGNYYAWGETQPKSVYNQDTYAYCHDNDGDGRIDNNELVNIGSNIAGTGYDAATVNWGVPWRMPSRYQFNEIRNNCTSVWTNVNGVSGRMIIGTNGHTVFFPVPEGNWYVGTSGEYWSSTTERSPAAAPDEPDFVNVFTMASGGIYHNPCVARFQGLLVRPVYYSSSASTLSINVSTLAITDVSETSATLNGYVATSNTTKSYTAGFFLSTTNSSPSSTDYTKNVTYSGSNPIGYFSASATELLSGTKYYFRAYVLYDGNYYYGVPLEFTTNDSSSGSSSLSCPDGNHPHMIDLGLPSGTKWACCNVGASAPEEYGNYYAWGETQTKSVYSVDTYQYYQNGKYVDIGTDIAGTDYDAATANWSAPWRMPSLEQCKELQINTTSVWTTQNGVNGRKFTASNGGTIFLPAAGYRWDDELYGAGSVGRYWSSTLYESSPYYAYALYFSSGNVSWSYYDGIRTYGQSVRPVR